MINLKYYSIGEFAKLIGKTEQTLGYWDKYNTLKPNHVTESGYRYYYQEQINHFFGLKNSKEQQNRRIIGYCRVSSNKQKDDLERQIENVKTYMIARGYQFDIISDIGKRQNTRRFKVYKSKSNI